MYYQRILDSLILNKLESCGALLLEGPKWCGKTSTCARVAQSAIYIQDPDHRAMYKQMADAQPSLLLNGKVPRLLDEWQTLPVLWDAVRFAVDRRQQMGQFILTGSAVPVDDQEILHSGTGRIGRLRMRPMSLWESKESSGKISLAQLFNGQFPDELIESPMSIEGIAYAMCRGGWPSTLFLGREASLEVAYNYVEELVHQDVCRVDGIERNPSRTLAVLRSYARNISTMTSAATIMSDVRANDISISDKTLSSYLTALKRIFVIENAQAWLPSLRSKTAMRTSEKLHFVDPSIAVAVLSLTPKSLLQDFNLFGFLFEDLCVRDMRAYAQPLRGEVFHYHDNNGLESDMVIRLSDGRWALVEVKTGMKEVEEAAANLIKLSRVIDTSKVGEPSFLMVLTGGQYAYRRNDGVLVVPIGCLRD